MMRSITVLTALHSAIGTAYPNGEANTLAVGAIPESLDDATGHVGEMSRRQDDEEASGGTFSTVEISDAGTITQTGGVSRADDVCANAKGDLIFQRASWAPSGASIFLDSFLAENGTTDWLHKMDISTTGDGTGTSTLNCNGIVTNTCRAPDLDCKTFTPPEYFFVLTASANANAFFGLLHKKLVDDVISDGLGIDAIIQDFGPDATAATEEPSNNIITKILKLIAPVGSIGDKVSKQATGKSSENISPNAPLLIFGAKSKFPDALGAAGGVINLIAAAIDFNSKVLPEAKIEDLKVQAELLLKETFDSSQTTLSKVLSQLFGGAGDADLVKINGALRQATGTSDNPAVENVIAQIFDSGVFLNVPSDVDSDLSAGISDGFKVINQQIIAGVLAAQNIFVFENTARTNQEDCQKDKTGRLVDGTCFTLEKRVIADQACQADSAPINGDVAARFPTHDIDLANFYKSVKTCNNGNNGDTSDDGSGFSHCTFSIIPFVSAKDKACNARGTSGIPDSIKINSDGCSSACLDREIGSSTCDCFNFNVPWASVTL
ncbi:hypothetical protein LTR10_008217 [Elasticomyces elasticus]|nr:hypothetical protein LTR10_008217 [Elasticomyces elasticus]KAK4967093.1 hypothetical protein LTR42_010441 [Elasticomyces elasticus]